MRTFQISPQKGMAYVTAALCVACSLLSRCWPVWCVFDMLRLLQEAAKGKAYVYAVLNFVCPLLSGLFHVHSNRLATLAQVKTSAAVTAELFRKSMRMSNA